jgi:hypothetical protein
MEMVIALVLFAGLIASWCVLPGGQIDHVEHYQGEVLSSAAVEQSM